MTESDLIEDEIKKASASIPESSSREKLNDSEIQILKNNNKNKSDDEPQKEDNKFNIEEEYLKLEECTGLILGPIKIYQKCFICPLCTPKKKENYICKFCYNTCHQKCRDYAKVDKKEDDYKGKKNFACYCGIKRKHQIEKIEIKEKKVCDLIILDESLNVESFFCENHQISICCVCSIECHKSCQIKKVNKNRNQKKCLCDGDKHTIYNEIALNFPINEYQKANGVSVWPIQILNILLRKKILENLSQLFKSMINKEKLSDEQTKEFFPLFELFSSIFNRKFKTPYYEDEIIDMFNYNNLVDYIKNIELNSEKSVILKFKLIYILLFVHLKNDFKFTKALTSIDFACNNLLERILYRKIIMKETIFNKNLYEKYKIKKLIEKDNSLKELIINDVCKLMTIGIEYLNIEEYKENFEISLKTICFWVKKMLFTQKDLINLINSMYVFFNKFMEQINSGKYNIFLFSDLISCLFELFLMIPVSYNDIIVMNYLDNNKSESDANDIKIKGEFIHVKSEHGTKLFEMIMKSSLLMKKHYDLLNKDKEMRKRANKKLLKYKLKMEIFNNSKNTSVKIKMPKEGIYLDKMVNEYFESLGIFSLADNIYYKQIDFITKDSLNDYYEFCNNLENDKSDNLTKNNFKSINEIINNLIIEIEGKFKALFSSFYGNNENNIASELKEILIKYTTQLNDILDDKNENLDNNNEMNYEKFKKLNREYIKNENIDDEDNKKVNKYLIKIVFQNRQIFPFLMKESSTKKCKDLVDILIVSNLDEILTKILIYFSNRKYPNLLTYDLLDIIYSIMTLYFFSKRGMKYLLLGKNLVRLNKIFNRYDIKRNNKNINEIYGKTKENNIKYITRTLEFCSKFYKGIKLYKLSIKNHKILERIRKNFLSHLILFNAEVNDGNMNTFIFQLKKIINIFYYLSRDYELEYLTQIKKQIVFIFKQNKYELFEKKSLNNLYNENFAFDENKRSNNDNSSNKLILKSNITKKSESESDSDLNYYNKIMDNNSSININNFINKNPQNIVSLYFAFFRLFGINTFYFFDSDENNKVLNILYDFTDLNLFKKFFDNNFFEIKEKLLIFEYLRSIYFIDNLNEYNILSQKNHLTTLEFNVLIKSSAIIDDRFNKCLDLQKGYSLPANIVNDLMNKYKKFNDLETIVQIYLNEVKNFPRQMLNKEISICKLFYKNLLFDIKYLSNYFYSQKNIWSKINLVFYQLCLEFICKIEVFKNVHDILTKTTKNDETFQMNEELYMVNLEDQNEHEFNDNNDNKNLVDSWENIRLSACKSIQKLKSIYFDIYDIKELYSYLNKYLDIILKISDLSNLYNLESYLHYYDEQAEANFTPFSLLETLDYEYFYEDGIQKQDEIIKKDINLYKIKYLEDFFFQNFINISNTNFMEIIDKIEGDINYSTQEFIEMFASFINSKKGNNFHLLNILICILTKMLFYNNGKIQNKFENFINDEYFFNNMNIILNYYLVLVFSLTKNIYAYQILAGINNLSKLIIQLLQSLGEGFNTTYHNNIFKLQKDISSTEKDEDDIEDNNTSFDDILSDENSHKGKENFSENNDDNSENDNNKINNIDGNLILNEDKMYEVALKQELPNIDVSSSIYETIIMNLKYALISLDMKIFMEGELPYDKLIISITNIIDFLIEYIESVDDNNDIIHNCFNNLFFGVKCKKDEYEKNNLELLKEEKCINLLFIKKYTDDDDNNNNKNIYSLRKKIICYVKNKIANLLIYYLLIGNKKYMIEKLYANHCSPFDLFSEIIYNFKELLNNLDEKNHELFEKLENAKKNKSALDFVDILIDCYGFEEDFRNMVEFPVIIQYYILIKIYEEIYDHKEIKLHFENIKYDIEEYNDLDDYNIRSKLSYSIYLFLEKIILKVEIKLDNNEEEEEDNPIEEKKENKKKIVNQVINNITKEPIITKIKKLITKIKKSEDLPESDSEEKELNIDNSKNTKISFFLRPYLTFALSEISKEKFIRDVDRTNASQKYVSLVNFADYGLFEMVVNRHLISNSNLKKKIANINYFFFELISYIVILINNGFILYYFYKSPELPVENYDIFDENSINELHFANIITTLAQIIVLTLIVIIWFIFEFLNHFQFSIMKLYNKEFLMRKAGEDNKIPQNIIDYFQDKDNVSSIKFFKEVNKNVFGWKLLYAAVFEASLFNREINMLLLTIIFNLFFILFNNYFFVIVEVLFIMNIVPTLFDILKAIKLKYLHLILVFILDLFVVYIFMWCGYFFFPDFFVLEDILNSSNGSWISEGYCYSSIQCYLIYIVLGMRDGIGDWLSNVSYKHNMSIFIGKFFHDVIFYIVIFYVMEGIFLGVILDTFEEIRDAQMENENDRNSICFICQLSSNACLTKNIDFHKHINEVHNLWNYVYFLNHLHLNNPSNFNRVESIVWEKLGYQDYSWIPMEADSDN